MSTAIAERPSEGAVIEQVVIGGDLARLTPEQRLIYYNRVCESVGLNPLTKPFDYLTLNGRLVLYVNRSGADQLRAIKGVSVHRLERELVEGIYTVTAYGRDKTGREDSSIGAVPVAGLKGEALANAYMKAETKAKRRLTLSLAGLGWLDETEVDSIPGAQRTDVDPATGEITREAPKPLVERIAERKAEVVEPEPEAAPEPSDEPTEAAGLSAWDFAAKIEEAGIKPEAVREFAAQMFGEGTRVAKLNDQQRAELLAALA